MMWLYLFSILLPFCISVKPNEKFIAIESPEPDYDISWTSGCINYGVSVYTYDFGFDQLVFHDLQPGETYKMKSYLGQPFFAVSPSHLFLGNFTVHWDTSKKPAVGFGESRHFIIKCPDDYLYLCDTCEPYDKDVPLTTTTIEKFGLSFRKPRSYKDIDPLNRRRHEHEISRVRMIEFQPPDIKTFTEVGFKSGLKLQDFSPESWRLIQEFYNKNKDTRHEVNEHWDPSNTYVHHWEAGVTVMHLPGDVKSLIWRDLKVILGKWANVDPNTLEGSSVYGIRRYWNGSILENHVDRGQQLVLSAIINVDQDVDEPWPLQIYDHKKKSYVVFMKPGDVVLYESAVAIHGRPLSLKGRFMANVFAHTKPRDWSYNKNMADWMHLPFKFDHFTAD